MERVSHVKAMFIGKDGSLGYKHGQYYNLKIVQGRFIIVEAETPTLETRPCPYDTVHTLLENWTHIESYIL